MGRSNHLAPGTQNEGQGGGALARAIGGFASHWLDVNSIGNAGQCRPLWLELTRGQARLSTGAVR